MTSHAIVGQEQAIELLEQAVAQRRLAPAYLLAGIPGIGRSLVARYFIELLLGVGLDLEQQTALRKRLAASNHPDVLWIEPTYLHQGQRLSRSEAIATGLKSKSPPLIRLEQVREITDFLSRSPLVAQRKVVVVEAAETMPEAAANALLKTLEEPGKATIILIATADTALLPTLVSRCQKIPCQPLNSQQMQGVLKSKGYLEILKNPVILSLAQGSPGEAIAAWQQLQDIPPEILQKINNLPRKPLESLTLARDLDKNLDLEQQLWLVVYLQHHYWQSHYQSHYQNHNLREVDHQSSSGNQPYLMNLSDRQLSQQLNQQLNQQTNNYAYIDHLEKAKKYLLGYVQPRLVWEVTLLKLQELNTYKVYS